MKNKKQTLATWIKYPDIFFKEALGVERIEKYQVDLLREIAENDKVAVRATHSVGKTWSFGRIALWYFTCFKNSIIITTAPTSRQVKALLWGEIRDAYKNAKLPLGGRLLEVSLKKSDKWYMMGFTTDKKAGSGNNEQTSSSFQGFHSDNVMIIFDEATGIEKDVWTMAEGLMTSGKNVKFLAIANPTTRNCEFYKCFSDISFKKIKISCFDSPNMIANGITCMETLKLEIKRLKRLSDDEKLSRIAGYKKPVPHLLTAQWVMPNILKWGLDHPLTLSKILGEFPAQDDTVLVQMDYVLAAMERDITPDDKDKKYIGVDVARYGADKTVITTFTGKKQTGLEIVVKRDLSHISGLIINMLKEETSQTIVGVDSTGLGSGVFDNLKDAKLEKILGKNIELVEVHFGQSPVDKALENKKRKSKSDLEKIKQDKERYVNLKSKMFDYMAVDLKDELDIFEESVYLEDFPLVKMKYNNQGKMIVESKDDYKERTGKSSPDEIDSMVIANYLRHIELGYGKFSNDAPKTEPMVKQATRKPRPARIKVTQY